jgi:VanZ family protein
MSLKNTVAQLLAFRLFWQIGLLVSMIVIAYLATTDQPFSLQVEVSDKLGHLLAFAELFVLARLGWPRASYLACALTLMLFGLAIEIVQAQLSYRDFSLLDLGADALGIAAGAIILWALRISGLTLPRAEESH